MHKLLRTSVILILLFLVSLSLRLFWLDKTPQGALIDEAHFGFLAKSILLTGKDEHGISYPLNFKGFGDDKLPLQVYLMVPVVRVFGLNNATIRYPSVFLGSLLPIVMYFLVKKLKFKQEWGVLAGFLTAVSPWTFILSRFGFESNLALFFFSCGLYFLISYLDSVKKRDLIGAAISFVITWYAYIAYRPITLVLSLVFVGLTLLHKKTSIQKVLPFLIVFCLGVVPLFQPSVIGNNSTRVSQVGIFSDQSIALRVDEFRSYCAQKVFSQLCYLASNKFLDAGLEVANRFYEVYSPEYLATTGEHDEKFLTVHQYGQFFRVLYPFLLLGIAVLLLDHHVFTSQKSEHQIVRWFLLAGLILTPIPAVLAGHPQKVRISALFPFMLVVIIFGLRFAYRFVEKNQLLKTLTLLVLFGSLMIEVFTFYTNWYTFHSWKNGYMYQGYLPKLFNFLSKQDESTNIVIKPFFSDPLMFYAYYTDMDPALYQQQAVLGNKEASGFQHTVGLGRLSAEQVSMGEIGCRAKSHQQRSLYVTDENIEGGVIVYSVYSENGVDPQVFVYDAGLSIDPQKCSTTP